MGKRFRIALLIFVIAAIILIGMNFESITGMSIQQSSENTNLNEIKKLIESSTDEQIAEQFDERFVVYLLRNINAQELHNLPLTSNYPRLELIFGDKVFNANVIDGKIYVDNGEIENEDVVIFTNMEEAIKMVRDSRYVAESFKQGRSGLKPVANKPELLGKGYLELYSSLAK